MFAMTAKLSSDTSAKDGKGETGFFVIAKIAGMEFTVYSKAKEGGFDAEKSKSFRDEVSVSQTFPPTPYWPFATLVEVGVAFEAGVTLRGSLLPNRVSSSLIGF